MNTVVCSLEPLQEGGGHTHLQKHPVNLHPGQRQLCSPAAGMNTEAAGVISGQEHKTLKTPFYL